MRHTASLRISLACLSTVALLLAGCSHAAPAADAEHSPAAASDSSPTATPTSADHLQHGVPDCASLVVVVDATLHASTAFESRQINGPVTVCLYTAGNNSPLIRFQTGQSRAAYASARAKFDASGLPTLNVARLGDAAYSSAGGAASTPTVVALHGTTEVLVTSAGDVANCTAIVAAILAML